MQEFQTTLRIEGMMCQHCETVVKCALLEVPGVVNALVSADKGIAIVTLNKRVSVKTLKDAVRRAGYSVL